MVMCKMTMVMRKMKRPKMDQSVKWLKLGKEECWEDFRVVMKNCQMTG